MKHRDEIHLWQRFKNTRTTTFEVIPSLRSLAHEIGIDEKRAAYLALKWSGLGLVDWGVSPLACWLTERGERAAIGLYGFEIEETSDD